MSAQAFAIGARESPAKGAGGVAAEASPGLCAASSSACDSARARWAGRDSWPEIGAVAPGRVRALLGGL
eukprot:13639881-Alexandrium_andersonii.AAC.1